MVVVKRVRLNRYSLKFLEVANCFLRIWISCFVVFHSDSQSWTVRLCTSTWRPWSWHRISDQWTKRCAKSFWRMLGCFLSHSKLACFHSVVCLFLADIGFNGTASQPHHWYPSMLQVDPSGGLRFLCYHLRLPDRSNTNPPGAQNRSELPNIPGQNQQVLSPSKIILMRRDVGHFREVAMIKWRHDAWMVDEIETCSCNQNLPFQVPPSHNLRSLSALACIFGVAAPSVCVALLGLVDMDQESPWWKHPNSDSCWIPWFFLVGLAQHLFKNVSPDAKQVRPRNWYARSDDTYNCNHLYIKMQHIIAQPNKNGLVGHASKKISQPAVLKGTGLVEMAKESSKSCE